MPAGESRRSARRRWWMGGACAALAVFLVGQRCMTPDPAVLFRGQMPVAAEIRGTPFRSARPAAAPGAVTATATATVLIAPPPAGTVPNPPPPAAPSRPPEPAAVAAPAIEAPPVPAPAEPATAAAASEPRPVRWDDLRGFSYVPPKPAAEGASVSAEPPVDQIPEKIRAMSGSRITIEGYAVPLDFEDGVVKKFILLAAPLACCFAEPPPMNQWMAVVNAGGSEFDTGKYSVQIVSGVFEVGEETRDGSVVGIYRLRAESVKTRTE